MPGSVTANAREDSGSTTTDANGAFTTPFQLVEADPEFGFDCRDKSTVCEIDADVPADAAFAECQRIESMLSTWRDDSELSRVNRGEKPSDELRALSRDDARQVVDPPACVSVHEWRLSGNRPRVWTRLLKHNPRNPGSHAPYPTNGGTSSPQRRHL